MATEMQKRAVEATLENIGRERPISKQNILRKAGYSEAIAKNPDMVFESKGFQELLDIYLPEDDLLKALNEDIKGKPLNRKAELELAFKLRGNLKDKGESNPVVNLNFFTNDQLRLIASRTIAGDTASEGTPG